VPLDNISSVWLICIAFPGAVIVHHILSSSFP
jgi:hypothetical protein